MNMVENLNLVTDKQYGGRWNRQAQSAVLNKVCYYDITRQTRTPSAFMNDGARACNNGIITSLSIAEGRSHIYTTNILQHQKFFVRTATGVTSEHYSYSTETPTQSDRQEVGWAEP